VKQLLANRRVGALWRFAVSVAVWYGAELLAGAMAGPLYHHHWRLFELVFRCVFLLLLLAGFCLLIVMADQPEGNPLAYMGLDTRASWIRDSLLGTLIGGIIVALAVAVIAIGGSVSFSFTLSSRAWGRLGLELVILLAGAMAEEVSFRGYPFQRMIEVVGPAPAVIIVSLLFGAVHWSNPSSSPWSILNTAVVGVLLCIAYLRTRKLWLPWGIHFGWNFALGVVFGLPVSGLNEFAVIIHGRARGPSWLTGGAYGIEASAVGTVVMLVGLLLLIVFTPTRPAQQVTPATAGNSESAASPVNNSSDVASKQ
jgi:CAAX protease family protein